MPFGSIYGPDDEFYFWWWLALMVRSEESKGLEDWRNQLCVKLLDMQDLRQLILLLLRQFSIDPAKKIPNDHRNFLCDILKTNHLLLLIFSSGQLKSFHLLIGQRILISRNICVNFVRKTFCSLPIRIGSRRL